MLLPTCSARTRSALSPNGLSFLLFSSLVLVAGCGEPNPLGRRAIHGKVTFEGKAVDYGAIQFEPDDPQHGVNSGAMIEDGTYQIKVSQGLPPGSYQVKISSPDRSQQQKVEDMPGDARTFAKERIPTKYNLKTTLKLEVPKARGSHEANFNLQ